MLDQMTHSRRPARASDPIELVSMVNQMAGYSRQPCSRQTPSSLPRW